MTLGSEREWERKSNGDKRDSQREILQEKQFIGRLLTWQRGSGFSLMGEWGVRKGEPGGKEREKIKRETEKEGL